MSTLGSMTPQERYYHFLSGIRNAKNSSTLRRCANAAYGMYYRRTDIEANIDDLDTAIWGTATHLETDPKPIIIEARRKARTEQRTWTLDQPGV